MKKDIFFEENQFILMAIESQVTITYRQNPELVDNNVEKVYNSLQRVFDKEVKERDAPKLRFTPLEQDLYDRIDTVCRLYTGEQLLDSKALDVEDEDDLELDFNPNPVSKTIIIQCMKRLRSSIKTWSGNTYGIRGYLDYISQFM